MATVYTRIYTYTGQSKWTHQQRTAAWADFKESGDTDRTIGQIISIQYEHSHASGSDATWNLQGQLTLSSGTTIKSDTVSKFIDYHSSTGNSDVVKFVNTFTTLPTVAQFSTISSVQTLSDGSVASNGVLTWKATSALPIRVIVSFYEEPPWVYHPQILEFSVKRGTSSGAVSDSGAKALLTIKLSLASSSYATGSTLNLKAYQGNGTSAVVNVNLSSYVSTLLTGVSDHYGYTGYTFSTDADYRFVLTFTKEDESVTATTWMSNTFVAMHIAPYSTGGVAIGDLSTASEGNPKFEVHHPSFFYSGIANIQAGVIDELGATAAGSYKDATVTFPAPYASGTTPVVNISFMSTSTAGTFGRCAVAVTSVNNEGFTFRFFNGDTSNRNPKFVYTAYAIPGDSTGSSGGGGTGEGGSGDSGGTEGGGGTTAESTPASRGVLGAVMPGAGLNIATDGTLSISGSYYHYTSRNDFLGYIRLGDTDGYYTNLAIATPHTARLQTRDYGTEFPTDYLYNGRLFFKKKT